MMGDRRRSDRRAVNLPVPFLSIYRSASDTLWTEAVTLERGVHEVDHYLCRFVEGRERPPTRREFLRVEETKVHDRRVG